MVKYYFEGSTFVIEDYQHAKRFSSFLPAMAGQDGKPLWAFYANVGQCMGGFGVNNKETPITPFDSATLAYQNIPVKSLVYGDKTKISQVIYNLINNDININWNKDLVKIKSSEELIINIMEKVFNENLYEKMYNILTENPCIKEF